MLSNRVFVDFVTQCRCPTTMSFAEQKDALFNAARTGDYKYIEDRVGSTDLDGILEGGFTLLHCAAFGGHTDTVNVLNNDNVDVDVVNGFNSTPLILASKSGHDLVVEQLICANCSLNKVDFNGETALFHAVKNSNTRIVGQLIDAHADFEITNRYGWSSLLYAVLYEYNTACLQLIKAGAKFGTAIRNASGQCRLMLQCAQRQRSRKDLFQICVGLKRLDLPVLLVLGVVDCLGVPKNQISPVVTWNVSKRVKRRTK